MAGQRWAVGSPGAVDAAAHPADTEARLLVVEDEPTILELLSGSLRFAGFDVVTAATGAEAMRAAVRARIPHLDEDRLLAPDIAAAAELVRSGTLVRAAGAEPLPGLMQGR